MTHNFYSNGKLLLTGEYAVLDGADAFAIPTCFGQSLSVEPISDLKIIWKALDDHGEIWFEDAFLFEEITSYPVKSPNPISKTLMTVLVAAKTLNSEFLKGDMGFKITTNLDFPRDWGLGTSSTLINNIAQWANVDAFTLLDLSFGGSGYDIACAQCNMPIVYSIKNKIPKIEEVSLGWKFTEQLFFVYLNKKQDSKQGIKHYRQAKVNKNTIDKITTLTRSLLKTESLLDFESIMVEHEKLVSKITGLSVLKAQLFSDYPGVVKSLGAWGGDFILATRKEALSYFPKKGYKTVIPFNEMINPKV